MKDNKKCNDDRKKPSGRRNYFIRRNTKEWYQGTRSNKRTGERRWSILGRR